MTIFAKDLSGNESFSAKTGTLIIDAWSNNKTTGKDDVTLSNGNQLTSTFSAAICPEVATCD